MMRCVRGGIVLLCAFGVVGFSLAIVSCVFICLFVDVFGIVFTYVSEILRPFAF